MPSFKVIENDFIINGVKIAKADLQQLRPNMVMPSLAQGIIVANYDGLTNIQSDGHNQKAGIVPWVEADALLADANLEADIEAFLNPPAPTLSLDQVKTAAKDSIDTAAEIARLDFITPGTGQAMVYEQKAQEAFAAQTDANPNPADYPLLNAEVGITAPNLLDVATLVLEVRDLWLTAAAQIEAIRLAKKKAIDEAADEAAVEAIIENIEWPTPQA